jgi:hypothetical protein
LSSPGDDEQNPPIRTAVEKIEMLAKSVMVDLETKNSEVSATKSTTWYISVSSERSLRSLELRLKLSKR